MYVLSHAACLGRTRSRPWVFISAGNHQCLGPSAFKHMHLKSLCFIFRGGLLLSVKLYSSYFQPLLQTCQIFIRYPRSYFRPDSLKEVPWRWLMESSAGELASIPSSAPTNRTVLCDLRSFTSLDCKCLLRGLETTPSQSKNSLV